MPGARCKSPANEPALGPVLPFGAMPTDPTRWYHHRVNDGGRSTDHPEPIVGPDAREPKATTFSVSTFDDDGAEGVWSDDQRDCTGKIGLGEVIHHLSAY